MSRFGGPYFEREGDTVVSVWLALPGQGPVPENYFEEYYGDDDERPFNRFSHDFGFGFYDHDFTEGSRGPGGQQLPVFQLVRRCSWSEHFAQAVTQQALALGIVESAEVYLMYEFAYDPGVTGISRSACMQFIGVFTYAHT